MNSKNVSTLAMKIEEMKLNYLRLIRIRPLGWLLAALVFMSNTPTILAGGDSWMKMASMPTARLGLAACAVDGKIYAIGGYRDATGTGLRTVEEYDPVLDSWAAKASMKKGRYWLSCSALNGKIYAIGGSPSLGSTKLKTVEEYDPASDTWGPKADMPTARFTLATCVYQGKIYAIGGSAGDSGPSLATLEVYDPILDSWEKKQDLSSVRPFLCAAEVNGQIYAIGMARPGGPYLAQVDRYDPTTDTWTRMANMPTARGVLDCAVLNGKIYVVGGRNGSSSALTTVEEYDPVLDTWTARTEMNFLRSGRPFPLKRWGLASAATNNQIFVMGGASVLDPPHPGLATLIVYTPLEMEVPAPEIRLDSQLIIDGQNRSFRLEWWGQKEAHYSVQFKESITSSDWVSVKNVEGAGKVMEESFPMNRPMGFYRVVAQPEE